MKITVKVKQAGRKHALLENRQVEIENIGNTPFLKDLLNAVVQNQVEEYNKKATEENLLPFLSKSEISDQAASGKVGFGSIYNENKTDVKKAQETALQAFEDGLFSVFADENEIRNLNEIVEISDSTVITFIRLTFLAGSYW